MTCFQTLPFGKVNALYFSQVSDLKITCQMVEKRAQEQKIAEEKKHAEEINFLKRTNQQLKAQLEGIISQKK